MSDDFHFSRSGTSHFGKLTGDVNTRLSEDEKADLMRASHIAGMSERRSWRLWPERGRGRGRKGAAMGFPDDCRLAEQHREAVHLLGNAVCPPVAADLIQSIRDAA